METALITGASRGIGLEFSRQYASDGWRVLACCRNPANSEALEKLAGEYPDRIQIYPLDVVDHDQIARLGHSLTKETIDLLINNAGILPAVDHKGFGHTDYAEWERAFRINSMAPLKLAETFATQIARSRMKTIATVTSKMGSITDNGSGGYYLYRSSKAAANMVVKSLALDLKHLGIKTVLLHPGWVKTEMGGPNAVITTNQSVSGMRNVIGTLAIDDTGKFFDFERELIPW